MKHINKLWQNAELLIVVAGCCCCFNGSVWRLCNPLLLRPLSHSGDVTAILSRKSRVTVAYWSNLQFVMAPRHRVVGEVVAVEVSTSRRLWSGFFLDRMAVTSPEWEKSLRVTRHLVPSKQKYFTFFAVLSDTCGGGRGGGITYRRPSIVHQWRSWKPSQDVVRFLRASYSSYLHSVWSQTVRGIWICLIMFLWLLFHPGC
jgi:hypothetical protein